MRLRVLVLVLVAAASVSCKKKEAAPAAPATKAPDLDPTERARRSTMSGPRQPNVVRKLAPITADEVQAFMPAPTGARVVRPFAHAQVGERIEGAWCFDTGELATLAAALERQYAAAGWEGVVVKPNPNVADRTSITAQKAPYALFGSLQRGKWAECNGAAGQTYVSLGVHHVEAVVPARAPTAPPGRRENVGASGTTDLRGP